MRTEEILNLDCEGNRENKRKINRILWKIKPVARIAKQNGIEEGGRITTEVMEEALHGICLRYNYRTQGIQQVLDEKEKRFLFWSCSLITKDHESRDWLGDVYGKTIWETMAKALIKIYADIRSKKEGVSNGK